MKLTVLTDYAMRVLVYLATSPGKRVRIQQIADTYAISHNHLSKVVLQLQRNGYIETVRGKGGGILLAQPPAEINIGEVTRQLETLDYLVECFHPDGRCAITGACVLQCALRGAAEAFMSVLDDYTLEDIVSPNREALRTALSIPLRSGHE